MYQIKDHLNSIRLSFADDDENGIVNQSEIREEINTYPFGLKHRGYNNLVRGRDHQYGYLGQEEQNELGLNWLTFRYRNYMPAVGRFFGVDPVSEEYMSISTYQFAHNNPIWKIEIEGLEGATCTGDDGADDIITHEPVSSEPQQAFRGVPAIVLEGAGGKAVQQVAQKTIGDKILSGLTKVVKGAGTIIAALLMTQEAHAPGPAQPLFQFDEDGNLVDQYGNKIDEKFKVDDKTVTPEGDSDSPIRRLEDSDDFSLVDEDMDTAVFITKVGSETLIIGGDFILGDDVLTINNFDIEGSEGNKVGIRALRSVVKQIGTALGVSKVVINGAARTTGANPGKITELTFDIENL